MRLTSVTSFVLVTAVMMISGCRVDLVAPEGVTIRSESGAFDCVGPDTCSIDVNDLFFDETFSIETNEGGAFANWKRRSRGFCGGQTVACRLFTADFAGNDLLLGFLESDEVFFLEAELASQLITAPVTQDVTIFADEPTASISNGRLFVGRTRVGSVRRGLIAFDLSGIPAGSTIDAVELTMVVSANQRTDVPLSLHRLQGAWGEGNQRVNERGQPEPATTNDATWRHRFFRSELWEREGGDFVANASAVANTGDTVTWSSGRMRADVQNWVDNPGSNFGWILIGDEVNPQSVQALFSKEADAEQVPTLRIAYTEPAGD
ncbi:MAG: DNRLRE domain-containing protein [Pseudomonadota bacterium]